MAGEEILRVMGVSKAFGGVQAVFDVSFGLELGRCIALKPELILCDELFSGLSMSEISSMVPLMERLQMEGVTLVMVEHKLRELFRLADRVIVMDFGRKIADGPPSEVMEDPAERKDLP